MSSTRFLIRNLVIPDFLDCVKTRQKFALAEDNGHHSCTIVNIGSLCPASRQNP